MKYLLCIFSAMVFRWEFFQKIIRKEFDAAEGVSNLMSQFCGEFAYRS